MELDDQKYIRRVMEVARDSRDRGNHPFGALLVDAEGEILLEAQNTTVTGIDTTGHAETNLVREATVKYDRDYLANCTVYASTEPCPMCAGAIFWANIGRVVFALSEERFYEIVGWDNDDILYLPCREIFARGQRPTEVVGPLLEEEARQVHLGFWE